MHLIPERPEVGELTGPLLGASLKLVRGNEHLDALDVEARAWVDSRPYGTSVDVQADGWITWSINLEKRPTPRIAVLAGDWAHAARCALNYLAWELVRFSGGTPGRQTSFPILFSPEDWDRRVGRPTGALRSPLRGVRADIVEIIQRLQPYYGRTFAEARRSYLGHLKSLNDADKHHSLQVTQCNMSPMPPIVVFDPPVEFAGYTVHLQPRQRIEESAKVVSVLPIFPPNGGNIQGYPEIHVSVLVGGLSVGLLFAIQREVARIVMNFERAFLNPVAGFAPDWTTGSVAD